MVFLLEPEYIKMAQKRLDFDLRKKFQGMKFRDFYELAAKLSENEDLLREENHENKTSLGSYFQQVEGVALEDVANYRSRVISLLKFKSEEYSRKNILPIQVTYKMMHQRQRKSLTIQ